MTLAEKYGIQGNRKVESINLNENPYSFEGTFKEFYGLVAAGRVKALKQGGTTVGISVGGYETIEDDNLAGKAFANAYNPYQAMNYLELATQLVEANLIPTVISENPLRITILNGLLTLDENGNEVEVEPEKELEDEEDVLDDGRVYDVYEVPYEVGTYGEKNIRNYIRKTEGRCLARGCELNIHYNEDTNVYEVTGIEWGRNLTEAERAKVTYIA